MAQIDGIMKELHKLRTATPYSRSNFAVKYEDDKIIRAAIEPLLTSAEPGALTEGRISAFWHNHSMWSQSAFGADAERGPIGPLKHLIKEAQEALQKPDDLEEKADCLFLIFDATRRSRHTLADLIDACEKKLEVNKSREWPKSMLTDVAIEHHRPAPAESATMEDDHPKPPPTREEEWVWKGRTFTIEEIEKALAVLYAARGMTTGLEGFIGDF